MIELVSKDEIEGIVGVPRSYDIHYGRAVTSDNRFYILHPQRCINGEFGWGYDLKSCLFSKAMENGFDVIEEDVPLILYMTRFNHKLNGVRSER